MKVKLGKLLKCSKSEFATVNKIIEIDGYTFSVKRQITHLPLPETDVLWFDLHDSVIIEKQFDERCFCGCDFVVCKTKDMPDITGQKLAEKAAHKLLKRFNKEHNTEYKNFKIIKDS